MKFKHKYLLAALPLSVLAGCSQQNGTSDATGATTGATQEGAPPVAAAAQKPGSAPEGSTARRAADKNGQPQSAAEAMQVGAHATRLAFSSEPGAISAGQPVTWTLKVKDAKTGAPVGGFETEMTKKMHLIVVKKDLSWFNHIHPRLGAGGTFTVQTVLPTEGSYKLYADYTPTGGKQEVPQVEIATGGQAWASAGARLTPDKAQGPWLVKTVSSHLEGEPDEAGGAKYQVAMMPMPAPLKAGQPSMLHFQIRDAKGKPISDLQPYLGAMGHCVILSQDTSKYLHSHPMSGGMGAAGDMAGMKHDMSKMKHEVPPAKGGPDVMFHTNFPQAGLYKAWGQFMHRSRVITASFVVNVGAGAPASISAGTSGTPDESKPHAH